MAHEPANEWLKMCIVDLDLPGSPWHAVKTEILKKLVHKLHEKAFTNEKLQVSYELGEINMPTDASDVNATSDSKSTNVKKQNVMKTLISIAAREAGCSPNISLSSQSEECKLLMTHIQNILSVNSRVLVNSKAQPTQHRFLRAYGPFLPVGENGDIELLGNVLSDILEKDPTRLNNILSRLKGRLMPNNLRKTVYQLILRKFHKESYLVPKTDEELRIEFATSVKCGMVELKTKDPTKSPVQHIIQTTIIDLYETLPALERFSKEMDFQKTTAAVLNIIYTCSKKYKYQYGLWMFPLQIAANYGESKSNQYELALQLDLLINHCLESRFENDICMKVWKSLQGTTHAAGVKIVQHFSSVGVDVTLDKAQQVLDTDMGYATEKAYYPVRLLNRNTSKPNPIKTRSHATSLFATPHPILCIRQWITNLFVGFTDTPVSMYLFDQIFMHYWDPNAIAAASLAILLCLSDRLIKSANADDVCAIMYREVKMIRVPEVHSLWKILKQQI